MTSRVTNKMVKIDQLEAAIKQKLIMCKDLHVYHQTEAPEYVNIRCNRDNESVEIWKCIDCLGNTLDKMFTSEQMYTTVAESVANQIQIPNGPLITHIYPITEVCPLGYCCEDCDRGGPDLYLYQWCKLHEAWVSQ